MAIKINYLPLHSKMWLNFINIKLRKEPRQKVVYTDKLIPFRTKGGKKCMLLEVRIIVTVQRVMTRRKHDKGFLTKVVE